MLHITEEGTILSNGLNFYPWKDRHTSGIGVKLRVLNRLWAIRYSSKLKKIVCWKYKV